MKWDKSLFWNWLLTESPVADVASQFYTYLHTYYGNWTLVAKHLRVHRTHLWYLIRKNRHQ